MNNITESFQVRLGVTQSDILVLKRSIDEISLQIANQHLQHYKYISETLQKRISDHVHIFQTSIKSHMNHVMSKLDQRLKVFIIPYRLSFLSLFIFFFCLYIF